MRWRSSAPDEVTSTSASEIDEPDSSSSAAGNVASTSAAASIDQAEGNAASSLTSSSSTSHNSPLDNDERGMDHAQPDIPWRPQTTTSTCEFTHVITDYANKRESGCKKAEYSATTVDNMGNRWRLIIYINGNGRASNHHLSLFLQVADADDLPFGWKKAVSYVLTLEHPTKAESSHFAKRNPDKTFKLCPKAIDWGWSQFITSDRIQQDGYVSNDSLTVRASVTVKSSSVSIDKEDAELYLKCAVEEGDSDSVQLCLDHGANVNCQFKDDLYTPLHTACSSGSNARSMSVLNLLLTRGADGNACNKWRETPLLIAANNGHKAAVEALLNHGADPSLCSEAGWSALTFAAHKGYEDIVSLLIDAGAPVNSLVTEDASTPLHKACAGSKPGHVDAVKSLLSGGADVHALNKWRETPLLTAANHGQGNAVDALLQYGADPCRCTDTGWSPLSIAAYKGHDEVVRLLLEEGASTEEDDPTLSALLQAATKGLPSTVDLLLSYDADHTVTTKKGDTALSILVEQNLIDAAADMVTKHGASIPRCSRDRKKVQRARLLIQLQLKKREEEDLHYSTDEDETDDEAQIANVAQHVEDKPVEKSPPTKSKKNKKKGKNKQSAEKKAKEAEEALLLELEREESKAKKVEAEANSKRARNKKKKEKERQRKMKEEQERREQADREAEELERHRQEKVEQERIRQLRERKEREQKELLEREKLMEAKLKERNKRENEVKRQEVRKAGNDELSSKQNSDKSDNPVSAESQLTEDSDAVHPPSKGRRWETNGKSHAPVSSASSNDFPDLRKPTSSEKSDYETTQANNRNGGKVKSSASVESGGGDALTTGSGHSSTAIALGGEIEHPTVTLFRREKLSELIQRCSSSVHIIDESAVKRAVYRWIVRSSHSEMPSSDPFLPGWVDTNQLVGFFQRQFIAESRRGQSGSFNIESMKEAGSAVAAICQTVANEVAEFRQRVRDQLPLNWDDNALGMHATESMQNGSEPMVCLSWANRASVEIATSKLSDLQKRYTGQGSRFFTAVFTARVWYETKHHLAMDLDLDCSLSSTSKAVMLSELKVSAELASDPFSVFHDNVFWGSFEYPDSLFGGQKPFAKDESCREDVLARYESSVVVLLPFDSMVASKYVKRILDTIKAANESASPLSFICFLHAECFADTAKGPSTSNLGMLDSRLDGQHSALKRVETLVPSKHTFQHGDGAGVQKICKSVSLLLVLQSDAGESRFPASDHAINRVIQSMAVANPADVPPSPLSFRNEFGQRNSPLAHSAPFLVDPIGAHSIPPSPASQRGVHTGYGTIGGSSLMGNASPHPPREKKSRLFDLVVDDNEEDQVDLVSGLLNNLDVGLFQNGGNVGSDVDIEAISIGAPSSHALPPGNPRSSGRFG